MKNTIFTGAGVAIVTPFDNNNNVNYAKLEQLIEFQIKNGTDAIIVCGTTGEAPTLSDYEHKEAIRFTVEKVNKRVPVIAGTGSNDTAYSVELSQYAKDAGADALLMVTPYYNKTTQAGLVKHFTFVADNVDLPIIVYNVPSRTGMNILPSTYKELSKHPNIAAAKEANGNISAIAETAELCGDDLDIYSGNDDQIVPILSLGGKGVISVLSNVLPRQTHDICRLFFEGKIKESLEMQLKLLEFTNNLFIEVNPIPVKTAMNLMGINVGGLRMPLCEMSEKNIKILRESMIKIELLA